MVKCILLLFLSILSVNSFAQFVKDEVMSDAIRDVVESTADWGDYDNDGDLDLAIAGAVGALYTEIYRNDEGTFVNINADLPGVSDGSVMWGDFDQDNDLDLILSGITSLDTRITIIYRNDNGVFVDHGAGLLGVSAGTTRWGDYDNDGDLDIAFIGTTDADNTKDILKVYRNESGVFAEVAMPVQPSTTNLHGSVSWGDYDKDDDLDLLVTGLGTNDANDDYVTKILRNDEGVFVDATVSLPGVVNSRGEWSDFDQDGDLDIALLGEQFDGSYTTVVYQNNGGSFTNINASLDNVSNGSIDWGDYDNDGDPDVLITGIDGITFLPVTKIYTNDEGVFSDAAEAIPGVWGTGLWGDYDQDGDLDLLISGLDEAYTNELTEVYENTYPLYQSISFEAIPDKTYGDAGFDLIATASSGLPISYEVISGPATVSGNTVSITGAGEVIIEASQNGDTDYDAATPVQQVFTIYKASLTATAHDQSITYGDALPVSTFAYSGFVNGEDATALTTEPTISTAATDNSGAGTYDIMLSGGNADNYTIILMNGTLTISKAMLTATADGQSITYGDDLPALTFAYSGFANGEDATALTTEPTISSTANADSDAGAYDITLSGGNADNYEFTLMDGTLTIHKAPLTVTAHDQTIAYGDDVPALTFAYNGLVNGEDATALTEEPTISTTATAESDAGTYDITLSGGNADNYTITLVDGTLTINKAEATITISDLMQIYDGAPKEPTIATDPAGLNYSITYDGDTSPPTEAGSYAVEVVIEDVNYQGQASATFSIELISGRLADEVTPEITIYPNPSDQEIRFTGDLKNLERVHIHDLSGKIILNEAVIGQQQLTISHITAGTYLLSLIDQKGTKQLTQIIIIK